MTNQPADAVSKPPGWRRALLRQDVLAGAMFAAVAIVGLVVSRDYPIGTSLRMGTGYVPRLLCWVLLGLGLLVAVTGFRTAEAEIAEPAARWRPLVFIPLSLIAFALSLEPLGIFVAGVLLVVIGALGGREVRPLEVAAMAAGLAVFVWAIFVKALGLPIAVWPGG